MRALVTGASGLIGAHIVRALVEAGHEVRALVRATSVRDSLIDLPVRWFIADLLRPEASLNAAFAGCDVVFHTAAQFSYATNANSALHELAVRGTDAVLRSAAANDVSRVIVTSSSVVFGFSRDGSTLSETAEYARSDHDPPYVTAKLVQHRRALDLGARLSLDVRLACPTMTLGPTGSSLGPSNAAVLAYIADPFGCTFPGGCNLVAARDVARGHLLIAQHGSAGESYLLGAENLSWQTIHAMIAELAGLAPPRITLNHTLAFLAATGEELRATIAGRQPLSSRQQATMIGRHYWYSHAKAATQLGYAPGSARDALVETISWLAASPHVSRELRARMRLAADIYRFRSGTKEPAT